MVWIALLSIGRWGQRFEAIEYQALLSQTTDCSMSPLLIDWSL